MTPSKSPSKRKSETDIVGRLCCYAGATDFNGSCVRSVRTSAFGHERSVGQGENSRSTPEPTEKQPLPRSCLPQFFSVSNDMLSLISQQAFE